jgi:hypothetical protein
LLVASAALLGFLALQHRARARAPDPSNRSEPPLDPRQASARVLAPAPLALASAAVPPTSTGSQTEPAAELPHPHPITPQHERIYRENTLTFSLDGAVDSEDVAGIRRLLASYRQEFPEDSLVLQQGYEIIANCLERPNDTTRAAAQRFYDTEIASALRRHVRRHCLE